MHCKHIIKWQIILLIVPCCQVCVRARYPCVFELLAGNWKQHLVTSKFVKSLNYLRKFEKKKSKVWNYYYYSSVRSRNSKVRLSNPIHGVPDWKISKSLYLSSKSKKCMNLNTDVLLSLVCLFLILPPIHPLFLLPIL